jgi:hypothetical protein
MNGRTGIKKGRRKKERKEEQSLYLVPSLQGMKLHLNPSDGKV